MGLLTEHVRALAAKPRTPDRERDSAIDAGASLSRLGIDSLMANQLLLWLQASFQVEVPLVRLMQGPTVRELAEEIARLALPAE